MSAMSIPNRAPDVEAEIFFLPTCDGGRSSPAWQGYRTVHDFGLPGILNDASHGYIGRASAQPGGSTRANIWLAVPELQQGRLYPGFEFEVREGRRIVAHGVIHKVLNSNLRRSA